MNQKVLNKKTYVHNRIGTLLNVLNNCDLKWIVLGLFMFETLLWTYLAGFLKHGETYMDEWHYVLQAYGIAKGKGLSTIYGLPFPSYRWLYSLVITPACMISDMRLRFYCIAFINSISMNMALFPIYFIAKSLIKKRENIIISMIICAAMPYLNLTISMTADILFFGLASWALYFNFMILRWRILTVKQRISFLVLWTVDFILMLLTKSAGAIFLGLMVLTIVFLVGDRLKDSKTKQINVEKDDWLAGKNHTQIIIKKTICLLIVFFAMAFLGRIVPRLLVKTDSLSKIQSTFLSVIGNITEKNFFKISIFYIFDVVLAFGIIPSLIPVMQFKKVDEFQKRWTIHVAALLLMTLIPSISMTYSTYLDGGPISRTFFRYMMFTFPQFVLLFIASYEQIEEFGFRGKNTKIITLISIIVVVSAFFWYRGAELGALTDHALLYWAMLFGRGRKWRTLVSIILSIYVLLSAKVLIRWPNKYLYFFMIVWLSVQFYDNSACYRRYRGAYETTSEDDILVLREFVKSHPEDEFLLIDNYKYGVPKYYGDQPMRRGDIYLDYENVKHTSIFLLNSLFSGFVYEDINLTETGIQTYEGTYEPSKIDYLLISSSVKADPQEGYSKLEVGNDTWYKVYKVENPEELIFIPNFSCIRYGDFKYEVNENLFFSEYDDRRTCLCNVWTL